MINNVPPFLQASGTASGGILTPTTEALRPMSPNPATFQELLSALQGLGEVSGSRSEKQSGVWIKEREAMYTLHIYIPCGIKFTSLDARHLLTSPSLTLLVVSKVHMF